MLCYIYYKKIYELQIYTIQNFLKKWNNEKKDYIFQKIYSKILQYFFYHHQYIISYGEENLFSSFFNKL